MSETYTNGGGRSDYRLPTVNANDNGKILKVVDGEWEKAENSGGGGSGGGVINLVEDPQTNALDMKYSDIVDALNAHKQIIVWFNASTWGSDEYPSNILRAFVLACVYNSSLYKVKVLMYDIWDSGQMKVLDYVATAEDGYPVFLAG